jgi:hypothetical protein
LSRFALLFVVEKISGRGTVDGYAKS